MLTLDSNSRIRIRSKKESAIWIVLLVVMSLLLCVAIVLATLSGGGFFAPVEGGAWWAYGETSKFLDFVPGAGFVRFVSETVWEMELVPESMFASDGANTSNKWCTGDYYFDDAENNGGTLHIRINSSYYNFENPAVYVDPVNVRLVDSNGKHIDNDTWVEYSPDADGIYTISIVLIDPRADILSEAAKKLVFKFDPPDSNRGQGYYLDDENAYYHSIYGEDAFSQERVEQTKRV